MYITLFTNFHIFTKIQVNPTIGHLEGEFRFTNRNSLSGCETQKKVILKFVKTMWTGFDYNHLIHLSFVSAVVHVGKYIFYAHK